MKDLQDDYQMSNEEAVEQLKVCSPDPPVPHVSIWLPSPISNCKDFDRITEAAADISISEIPFVLRANKNFSISPSLSLPLIIEFIA